MAKKNNKSDKKDGIIFILIVVLLYNWFIVLPNQKESYKEACRDYAQEKRIDKTASVYDYFDAVDGSNYSSGNNG